MRRALYHAAWVLALLCVLAPAQSFWQSRDSNYNQSIPSVGCTEATSFLARTSGLNAAHQSAYTSLICGMVTDGDYANMYALYILATADVTTAKLALNNASFNATQTGSITFAADDGMTGDASTGFLNSQFNSFAAGASQNSLSLGVCVESSRTTSQGWIELGNSQSSFSFIQPRFGTNIVYAANTGTPPSAANTNAQGLWMVSRTGPSVAPLYLNGALADNGTAASATQNNGVNYIFAMNNGAPANFSGDKLSAAFFGIGFNATSAANIRTRINTYLTAIRGSTGC